MIGGSSGHFHALDARPRGSGDVGLVNPAAERLGDGSHPVSERRIVITRNGVMDLGVERRDLSLEREAIARPVRQGATQLVRSAQRAERVRERVHLHRLRLARRAVAFGREILLPCFRGIQLV